MFTPLCPLFPVQLGSPTTDTTVQAFGAPHSLDPQTRPPDLVISSSDEANPLYQDSAWTPQLTAAGQAVHLSGRRNPLWSPDVASPGVASERPPQTALAVTGVFLASP